MLSSSSSDSINMDLILHFKMKDCLSAFLKNEKCDTKLKQDITDIFHAYAMNPTANDKPIILFAGWPYHLVGVAIIKDKLIYCNAGLAAGFEDDREGILIYDLKNSPSLEVISELELYTKDASTFTENFKKIVKNPESPSLYIPIQSDNPNESSISNLKNMYLALLLQLEYNRQRPGNEVQRFNSAYLYASSHYQTLKNYMHETKPQTSLKFFQDNSEIKSSEDKSNTPNFTSSVHMRKPSK